MGGGKRERLGQFPVMWAVRSFANEWGGKLDCSLKQEGRFLEALLCGSCGQTSGCHSSARLRR